MTRTPDKDIAQLIDRISENKEYFLTDRHSSNDAAVPDERKRILTCLGEDARKLMTAVQDPNVAFWELVRRCSLLSPIKVAQDMGVFDYLHNHNTATAKELAAISGGDESLIIRILRPIVAEGLLDDISEEIYSLTTRGSPFGLSAYEEAIAFARLKFLPIVLFNPIFFQQNGYKEPQSHEGLETPLAAFFQKPGYGFFDYLNDHPDVHKSFVVSMKAQLKTTRLTSSVYPYGERLKSGGHDDNAVTIVDVGGSRGELLLELKSHHPGIAGRLIVQDQQAIFDSMTSKPPDIELMAHDIFTQQPIIGATAYHLKRVLHDWGDERCRIILAHLIAAMDKERSTLLIVDAVMPMKSASFSQAMGDHSMLTFGGKERNEKQWHELVSSVGLAVRKIYKGPEPEAVIECYKL